MTNSKSDSEATSDTLPVGDGERLSLYGRTSCGYCVFVLREIERLGVDVPFMDTTQKENREALIGATGRTQVPVLRIETPMGTRWMPESVDIVRYLKSKVGAPSTTTSDLGIQVLGAAAIACLIAGFTFSAAKIPLWIAAGACLFLRAMIRWRR